MRNAEFGGRNEEKYGHGAVQPRAHRVESLIINILAVMVAIYNLHLIERNNLNIIHTLMVDFVQTLGKGGWIGVIRRYIIKAIC